MSQTFIESVKRHPEVHRIAAEICDEIAEVGEREAVAKYNGFVVDVAKKLLSGPATDRQAATFMDAVCRFRREPLPEEYKNLLESTEKALSKTTGDPGKHVRDKEKLHPPFTKKGGVGTGPLMSFKGTILGVEARESRYRDKVSIVHKMRVEIASPGDIDETYLYCTIPKPLRDHVEKDLDGSMRSLIGYHVQIETNVRKSPNSMLTLIGSYPKLVSWTSP